ncbi:hypothetical protein A3I48_01565 [Candidatus Daviesbacteria bacterium RIFCSPLOWO2_02_FULL_36_7]|uniref:Nucleotidyl transferase AbiEii/AbiGii toxin family protein n=1 Tax=Candidatus Daviesbacteria bacterium RIFCSPLOWO2_02_FULL_36_7 TaxID=1797792 RepID=A0A1F5MHP4_9BACT|nr:MAG: hypothetical protein A3I48_01565 [Candidatus Daviesbacteria bacterium RIFCSPLOWO2_02_FULL_36_7]
MVNLNKHRQALVDILRTVYSDTLLRNVLGFKGGTAAMLFYGLPRFSVDLDFDLLDPDKKEEVFKRLQEILPQFGRVVEAREKYYTLLFIINYQKGERNLKIDISKRPLRNEYETRSYLGIPMLVMKEADMAACKLSALLTRRMFATRDMYDVWFFLKEGWDIDERVLKENTNMTLVKALKKAQKAVQSVKITEILAGLGELLEDNKQKAWVKDKLKNELLFQLRLCLSNISKR